MSFLTFPLLLGGAAACLIPVLLHLIMRGVPKRIEFPPLRFLVRTRKVNQRKFRLRHLLLLLLRIGVCLLLGLALARPSFKLESGSGVGASLVNRLGSQAGPIAAAIVIDNSPRMEYQFANETRLEVAKDNARWLLSQLPQQSQIAVISGTRMNDSFQVDTFSALERINLLSVNPGGRAVGQSVNEAIRLLKTSDLETKEIYVFTDLTQASWPQETANSVRAQLETAKEEALSEIGVYIVDVGVQDPSDSGIAKLNLSSQILSTQSSLEIEAEITHFGKSDSRVLELITSAGELRSQKIVELPEGHSVQSLNFPISNLPIGIHQGQLRFTTSDALAVDDQYYFTVDVRSAWKILIVANTPVERNTLFVRKALDPSGLSTAFQTDTASFAELESFPDKKWDEYQAMILLDPKPLTAQMWKKLTDYATSGRGVGLFLGRNANPIRDFQTRPAIELLGAKPTLQTRAETAFHIAPEDLTSPTLSELRQIGDLSLLPWETQPIYRYWELSDLADTAHVELRFSNRRPAVVSRPVGQGTVLIMTTPVSDSPSGIIGRTESGEDIRVEPWNLLPTGDNSWLFIGLMDGIARILVGAGDQSFNYLAGQTATIMFQEGVTPTSCSLILPDGST
ncbi:MAG: BatA domain-containing protein, partial [Thermoguttaceae bacterium]